MIKIKNALEHKKILMFLIIGFVLSIIGLNLFTGPTEGAQGILPSIKIPINNHYIHLHHWFLAAVALTILLIKETPRNYMKTHPKFYFIFGALIGSVAHGIVKYNDWYMLIYPIIII